MRCYICDYSESNEESVFNPREEHEKNLPNHLIYLMDEDKYICQECLDTVYDMNKEFDEKQSKKENDGSKDAPTMS